MATLKSNILNFDIPYITSVRYIYSPHEGIAKSKRSTGLVVINRYYFDFLPDEHKLFVLLHEAGHIAHSTVDEMTADEFASNMYLKAGFPISESVKALAENLNEDNPVHIARSWAQYQRALEFDYRHNNNQKAYRADYDSIAEIKQNLAMAQANTYAPEWTQFLGIAIGRKAVKRKDEKKKAQVAIKNARAQNILSKAQSRVALAEQGIVMPSGGSAIGQSLAGVAGLVGNLTGAGQIGNVLSSVQGDAPVPQQSLPDLMTQVPPAIFNTGEGRSMGSMAGDSSNIPVFTPPFNPQTTGNTSGNNGTGKEKDKNKNLPWIIGGALVSLLLVVFLFIKK